MRQQLYFIAGVIAASITTATAGIAARATAGCGKVHLLPGITTYHGLTSSGRDRTYSVHLPSGYDRSKPYPVVLGFHGSSSIGFFFEVDTRLSERGFSANVGCPALKLPALVCTADNSLQKIMVYPDGVGVRPLVAHSIIDSRRGLTSRLGCMGWGKLLTDLRRRRPPVCY